MADVVTGVAVLVVWVEVLVAVVAVVLVDGAGVPLDAELSPPDAAVGGLLSDAFVDIVSQFVSENRENR